MLMKAHRGEMLTSAYTRTSRTIHWLMTILIIGMLGLGWYMMSIEDDPGSDWYFMVHKSIGILVLLLASARLFWRLGNQPPQLPAQVPSWQIRASKISHWSLYGAMIAMPVAGLTGALLSKGGITLFGLPLPRLMGANHDLSEIFFFAHSVIAWVFVGLISLHVLAALKHLLVNKDGVFQRMWL
jgi:cytochrome b561